MTIKIKLLVILMGFSLIGGALFVRQLILDKSHLETQLRNLQISPAQQAKAETASLVGKVSKLILLPQGEDPTVATITDREKLQNQPAFGKAQNGDKVLIYVGARKAYIYSPSKNVIVDVVSVNIATSTPEVAGANTNNSKVAIYNGTSVVGLANLGSKKLRNLAGVTVLSTRDAAGTYDKTIIVDLTGVQSTVSAQVTQALGGTVAALPLGETVPPGADILVILGKDFSSTNR